MISQTEPVEKLQCITIAVPETYIKMFKELEKKGMIKNRSDGIRKAVLMFLDKDTAFLSQWRKQQWQ
jgi:metal-responsive CopG/Arc/MetJ family transcriptional regulator